MGMYIKFIYIYYVKTWYVDHSVLNGNDNVAIWGP